MREYLERLFPILSNDVAQNEQKIASTWNLYDLISFFEFCVFFLLRTILDAFFAVCGVIVKFGIILLLTYAFAFTIFYYFDNFVPEERENKTSGTTLKRPSEFGSWPENIGKNYPYIINYSSKSDEHANKFKPTTTSRNQLNGIESENASEEEVVRVGSFKRSTDDQKSSIGRALEDIANIKTKTYETESKSETVSIKKGEEIQEIKSSNA